MRIRQLLLISLLALLTACGGSKYPYPPQFVAPDDVSIRALPVPPVEYSREYNAEIDEVLARQAKLTEAQKAVIREENHITPTMIVQPVLGKRYTPERYPAMYALLKHAGSDAWRISDSMEDYWGRPRPWYADGRVALLVPAIRQPGYPSGHTTTNTVWAYVLGELFPAKREALLARAWQIGQHRVDGGAHFPHDVRGGRTLGWILFEQMRDNPAFKQELAEARAEIARQGGAQPSAVTEHKPIPKSGVPVSAGDDTDAAGAQESWWDRHVLSVKKKPEATDAKPAAKPAVKPERHSSARRMNCIAIHEGRAPQAC